jgi:glucose/arabinose dehydrogenase
MKPSRFSLGRLLLALLLLGVIVLLAATRRRSMAPPRHSDRPVCARDNGGLALPRGLCALVVAKDVGRVRHLVVAPNGDIFANVEGRGLLALRDTSGDGVADVIRQFGGSAGTGVALSDRYLYYSTDDAVYRYAWKPGQLEPAGQPEPVVAGLPSGGDHTSKSIALGPGGVLFVNIGSATNSCQERNRASRSPGRDPCTERETRAGIWRFSVDRPGQRFADGERWSTGLRNTVALAVDGRSGGLYGAVNGRDQLAQNWGFTPERSAENPGEEFGRIERGDDYGWPYCYYDVDVKTLVLAPEYGGDGKQVGRCASAKEPLLAFPAHWAPLALAFGPAKGLGDGYEDGVFVAFHGSWNRAPLPQAGYRVVWQPLRDGVPAGAYRTLVTDPGGGTSLRPSGVAVGPDGSLYVAADANGTVWRILSDSGAARTREAQ